MSDSPTLEIKRFFTSPDQDVYETVEWEARDAEIPNDTGDGFVFQQKGVEFPKSWSQRATNIVASKYFYGSGKNREYSLKQLIERVVNKITQHGIEAGYFLGEDSKVFADELRYILLHQIASFNSPVWFNIGVEGIPQQASACYINHVEDNMESILELAKTEGMIFKRGSGAGVNISALRHEGAPLSGGGQASGPLSFMKALDAQAGVIKSGGVTRRAAKMVVMDADHPDVEKFIFCKINEEKKAHALIEAGYDSRLDGEAYGTVAFQNANHSVRFTDEQMDCARIEGYAVRELLKKVAEAAWECGDPGVQFTDIINAWHTCKESGPITASNPCSEFVFLDNTSCNLASINLVKALLGEGSRERLEQTVKVLITAMDILCDLAEYPTPEITKMTQATRPLGLGFANLGAYLMLLGLPYDSEDARGEAASIMAFITGHAYRQSQRIASVMGPFELYEKNTENMLDVIEMHHEAAKGGDFAVLWRDRILDIWYDVRHQNKHGFRNAQVTVLAPTGTISFMMDCETTGIEPLLAPTTYKTLVGGGVIEQKAECYQKARQSVGDDTAPLLATSIGQNQISPEGHLRMVAAVQPYISGAVSKTINLPHDATPDDIFDIYQAAWQFGVKCVSVYRDGCKRSQPLSDKKASESPEKSQTSEPEGLGLVTGRTPLPDTRKALTHKFKVGGHKGYLTVGLYEDGLPGEIFVSMAKEGSTISGLLDAWAVNVSIMLQYGIPLDVIVEKHKHSRYEPAGFTGNPAIPNATSVTDYVVRWLETSFIDGQIYVSDRELTDGQAYESNGMLCQHCGGIMQSNGTCHACTVCGATTGCG